MTADDLKKTFFGSGNLPREDWIVREWHDEEGTATMTLIDNKNREVLFRSHTFYAPLTGEIISPHLFVSRGRAEHANFTMEVCDSYNLRPLFGKEYHRGD